MQIWNFCAYFLLCLIKTDRLLTTWICHSSLVLTDNGPHFVFNVYCVNYSLSLCCIFLINLAHTHIWQKPSLSGND